MSVAIYDSGRDGFLARSTSKPPSKFDSIEYLNIDAGSASGKGKSRKTSGVNGQHTARSICSSNLSTPGSNATTTGVWSWGDGNSSSAHTEDMTLATHSSWKAEVSGRRNKPATAPSSRKHRKKFFWGPRVARQGQEMDREVRSTNKGEPATFALGLERCPSTVSTIRSLVPRAFPSSSTASTHDDDSTTLIAGLEPYIRTSITDRIHDGIYDTDTAHKSTLGGRIKRGEIRSPHISRQEKAFAKTVEDPARQQFTGPGHYDTSSGIDATSEAPKFLPLPRDKCNYDSYIRRGLGQTTGSEIGPGCYGWEPATTAGPGPLAFSAVERWPLQPTSKATSNRGPWHDAKDAWGRGGYIERAVPRDCKSYLPPEILWYTNHLDLDRLGKESFTTAMRRHPKRYAASFSNTQEPDWRVNGHPALGPGTYAVERAETLVFPAPQGGAGDADPARPSLPFRVRYTPFDTRHLAGGYKTLKPRFSTPRSALYASELPGRGQRDGADLRDAEPSGVTAAERTAGELIDSKGGRVEKRLTPMAKAAAVAATAAADPWAIGGKGSKFVRLERPSVLDPVRDGSRRRAAAATWRSLHRSYRGRGGLKS